MNKPTHLHTDEGYLLEISSIIAAAFWADSDTPSLCLTLDANWAARAKRKELTGQTALNAWQLMSPHGDAELTTKMTPVDGAYSVRVNGVEASVSYSKGEWTIAKASGVALPSVRDSDLNKALLMFVDAVGR